jgi:general secretion pathway protein I
MRPSRLSPLARGFTLIEVLVALVVVAIALAAGAQASGALTRNADRQAQVILAQLCAENELVRLRLSRQLPGVGDIVTPCEQAGQTLQVETRVIPTPNPNFRRVDARVLAEGQPLLQVTTVLGRN